MIMQCPDFGDEEDRDLASDPLHDSGKLLWSTDEPGMLYRGVPQDSARRTLRIDRGNSIPQSLDRTPRTQPREAAHHAGFSEICFG